MKEKLINDIEEYQKIISDQLKKDDIVVDSLVTSRGNDDYSLKYDIKDNIIFVSLACEDLTNCDSTNWCDTEQYNDVSMYDLDKLEEYSLSDLDNIIDLLAIVNGDM